MHKLYKPCVGLSENSCVRMEASRSNKMNVQLWAIWTTMLVYTQTSEKLPWSSDTPTELKRRSGFQGAGCTSSSSSSEWKSSNEGRTALDVQSMLKWNSDRRKSRATTPCVLHVRCRQDHSSRLNRLSTLTAMIMRGSDWPRGTSLQSMRQFGASLVSSWKASSTARARASSLACCRFTWYDMVGITPFTSVTCPPKLMRPPIISNVAA